MIYPFQWTCSCQLQNKSNEIVDLFLAYVHLPFLAIRQMTMFHHHQPTVSFHPIIECKSPYRSNPWSCHNIILSESSHVIFPYEMKAATRFVEDRLGLSLIEPGNYPEERISSFNRIVSNISCNTSNCQAHLRKDTIKQVVLLWEVMVLSSSC